MGEADIPAEVERIGGLTLPALRALWTERYGDPPTLRSVPILRQLLAWRIQAEVFGDLDRPTRRALERKGLGEAEGLALGTGARLTRVWQGRIHAVIVEAEGFCWEGRMYRSLSAVATAIAGSRWNGPRFFGLRSDTARTAR